jgi:parvulin-like peptidyl-prolyl isomerase
MKKLVLLGLLTFLTFSQAKMIDAIAVIVEGEPVTTAEIAAVQQQMNISKKEATDLLIKDRLQKSAMNAIEIAEDSVDSKIESIAAQNNLTIPKMQKVLKEQGTTWRKYRSSVRKAMKKEKFFQEKVVNTIPPATEDQLKLFYTNNRDSFVIPTSINMIEYSASTESKMKNFLQTKNKKGIKSRSVTKQTKDINEALLGPILQTQDGSFTRPFNAGNKFISYEILSKSGQSAMPYEAAKGAVSAKWKQQQQSKALKDYFEKLKTNADVQYIR